MDSFVFLDDNPFERNMVRSFGIGHYRAGVAGRPAQYSYVQSLNLFETTSYSRRTRTELRSIRRNRACFTAKSSFESMTTI